ncbi:hypothetical protein PR048_000700 [Dryococelus australis]|uniref:Uncharacterized protein n=1 Tax=Dryococelus australis TaxID=614101 RepID=A0ABQ9IFB9_9NEOP|nr:hypothetical protein PR048_000700 [Dryococelus australis]
MSVTHAYSPTVQPASRTLHCLILAVADFASAGHFSRCSSSIAKTQPLIHLTTLENTWPQAYRLPVIQNNPLPCCRRYHITSVHFHLPARDVKQQELKQNCEATIAPWDNSNRTEAQMHHFITTRLHRDRERCSTLLRDLTVAKKKKKQSYIPTGGALESKDTYFPKMLRFGKLTHEAVRRDCCTALTSEPFRIITKVDLKSYPLSSHTIRLGITPVYLPTTLARFGRLITARSWEPMKVIEVNMERRRNAGAGETGDPETASSGTIPTCQNPDVHDYNDNAVSFLDRWLCINLVTAVNYEETKTRDVCLYCFPTPPQCYGCDIEAFKGCSDKVSTFEISLRKKPLPLRAHMLTGAPSDMCPVKLVTMDGKSFHILTALFPKGSGVSRGGPGCAKRRAPTPLDVSPHEVFPDRGTGYFWNFSDNNRLFPNFPSPPLTHSRRQREGNNAAVVSFDRRMNKVMRSIATLILHKAEDYTTCIQVDLKQGFQKCSFYREQSIQPIHSYNPLTVTSAFSEALLKFYFKDIPPPPSKLAPGLTTERVACPQLVPEFYFGQEDGAGGVYVKETILYTLFRKDWRTTDVMDYCESSLIRRSQATDASKMLKRNLLIITWNEEEKRENERVGRRRDKERKKEKKIMKLCKREIQEHEKMTYWLPRWRPTCRHTAFKDGFILASNMAESNMMDAWPE